MLADDVLRRMANDVVAVHGVVGVVLGGSRARGDASPTSDVDLGVYYAGDVDTSALSALAGRWSDVDVEIGPPGSWGPWVNAGGWLVVEGVAVDWILRDLDRVREQWRRAQEGRFHFHAQPGHPLGFLDVAYAGELATSVILADPRRSLAPLQVETARYPEALRRAMIDGLWEAGFLVDGARKVVARGDTAYVSLCLSRAVALCAHALHAAERRWVTNEKGLIPSAGRLERAPAGLARRAAHLLGSIGTRSDDLAAAIELAAGLVDDVRRAVRPD
jgi:predicted nucleotidyltransferase